MALSNKRKQGIKKDAARQSRDIESVEKMEAFQKDYEDIMVALNEAVEERLDVFEGQAISILRELNQARPASILAFANEEKGKILALTQSIMSLISPLIEAPFRQCMASCVKDIIDICASSIADQHKRTKVRAGIKPQ
jgi:hypothetical protein